MTAQDRLDLSPKILKVIQDLQVNTDAWVNLANIGGALHAVGVNPKQYGLNLSPFLNEFQDMLEFRNECPEGRPPVRYVRLKSVVVRAPIATVERKKLELGYGDETTNNLPKPPYQNGKSALMALGFVNDIQGAIAFFTRKTGISLSKEELERRVKASYDNGDILYYEYDVEGNPIKCNTFSQKTAVFAINTGTQDQSHEYIFAQYNKGPRGWMGVLFNTKKQIYNHMNTYKIGKLTFKNYTAANEFIKNLHDTLLPGEVWKYIEPAQMGRKKTEYEILESYLRTVFAALVEEHDKYGSLNYGKIKFSKDNNYALFNTGLLSKYAKDVIIIGEVYPKKRTTNSRITLSNPVVLTRGITELSEKGFEASDANVDMVSFFKQVSQIVYDATVKIDTSDYKKLRHCIDEAIMRNRFPQQCKEQYENGELEKLTDDFIQAIRRAERIARRNYKYVVPQYRTTGTGTENRIQFLMPIYMLSKYEDLPDFALVLSSSMIGDQKFYIPETVLELAWAYNNARVICKPDDMWLDPTKIEDVEDLAIDE